jgi:hypothetical protein
MMNSYEGWVGSTLRLGCDETPVPENEDAEDNPIFKKSR